MTYETWRPVTGFPGYEISDLGNVKSLPRRNSVGAMRRGRILKQDLTWAGYYLVRLARDGVNVPRLVHRLVLEAFVGESPEGFQARHLNGVRDDNRLDNLKWGTIQENRSDQKRHGTGIQGARNPKAKLTAEDVSNILTWRGFGYSQDKIARRVGVCQAWVSKILRKGHWTQQAA